MSLSKGNGMQDVIDFWFKEIDQKKWWVKNLPFDHEIQSRFGSIHKAACDNELSSWRVSPLGRLAEVIVLDQFSRNIYRGLPESFASDPLALKLAQEAVSIGADKELEQIQKLFLYMPYMHSESLEVHDQALKLFEDLGLESNLKFEYAHRNIILKFGRYPHRNEILGRESTPEELIFLSQPGSSF